MKLAVITALGALALSAAPAVAQPTDAPPPPGDRTGPPFPGQGMGGRRERIDELRAALKLRPDQEDAFSAYQAALRPDPALREKMRAEREKMAALPADQRRAERQSNPDWEAMRAKREQATSTFLAALTPDQRQAFQTFRRDHRSAGPMGGGFGGPPPGSPEGGRPPPG